MLVTQHINRHPVSDFMRDQEEKRHKLNPCFQYCSTDFFQACLLQYIFIPIFTFIKGRMSRICWLVNEAFQFGPSSLVQQLLLDACRYRHHHTNLMGHM